MSAGKRFKFNGSTIAITTAFTNVSPTDSISAISKANPAVVTETAHGRLDGDVIKIGSAAGMTEVNDRLFVIDVIDANSYRLLGVNSTGYGTYTSGGKVYVPTWSNWCELKGYNRQPAASPDLDATTICSESSEYEVGLPDPGTTQFDFNFAPRTAIQVAAKDYYDGDNAGKQIATRVDLPANGGRMIQIGTIQQMTEQASVNQLWQGSLTQRNTGKRYDFDN